MKYYPDPTILPALTTVAEDLDGIFNPTECLNKLIVRRGKIKHRDGSTVDIVAAAMKVNGELGLYTEYSRDGVEWQESMSFTTTESRKVLKAALNLVK